jgi:dipeptidyl aminopeptidase/acylaminoacyl peptidase
MTTTSSLAARIAPFGVALATVLNGDSVLRSQQGYQKPPKAVLDVLHAPLPPQVLVSPTRDRLLLAQTERYPPIADLAQPFLKLAGLRIDPVTNGPHAPARVTGLTLQTIADGSQKEVRLPPGARLGLPLWAPDGKRFAFTHTTDTGIELWLADAATGAARRIPGVRLSAAYGVPVQWMPDGNTLLCQAVPPGRGRPPAPPRVPAGPTAQESAAKPSPVRTFQDLLQNAHDEKLFDYYAASQLVVVDPEGNRIRPLGKPAVIRSASPSPDSCFFLVTVNHRPYSYLLPAFAFPQEIEVWDRTGKVVHRVASLPLADQVPIEGVPTGPRLCHWRPTAAATLVWVEALDSGDPRKHVPHRDRLLRHTAPFEGKPAEWLRTAERFAGITRGEKGSLAFVRDYDRQKRWQRTLLCDTDQPEQEPRLVWSRSIHDRYEDPGDLLLRTLPTGQRVFRQHQGHIYLAGSGATPKGDRPFLDRMSLDTFQMERLFRSEEGCYESVVGLLTDDAGQFLTRHESPRQPPNYFVRTKDGKKRALTDFPDPAPQLRGISRQLVTYQRDDGVPLSFTLYLPPGYHKGQRLPALLWAYPREFVDAGTAGQVSGSPHRFATFAGPSHLFLLLQGYAILDGASMPVVGDPETVNNTYIDQIVSSARAAIKKADELGVIDPGRVAVGGHSYGAFMTANLLAHCDLFKAGIARSGAYNRTLTPFGFQSERRTLWEAPELYVKVSPFVNAHKIKTPLLLIHGEADDNPGTFPVQSERMYHAVKGNGGTVRYVTLPYESHGYLARESVEHTLYEMIAWLDRFVKNAR